MEYKAATSRCPTRAVGYLAQGRGVDGDGGGTAGTSLAGVVAARVSNSHIHENPHPTVLKQSAVGSNCNPPPYNGSDQSLAPKRARGRSPDGAEVVSQDPPLILQSGSFKIATWNMCGQGTKSAPNSKEKICFVEQLMTLEQIDIMVLTETHTTSIPMSCRVMVLEQTGLAARVGVAILTKAGSSWDILHNQVLIPGYVVIVNVLHEVSRESFWVLGVYGDISWGQVSLSQFLVRLRTRLSAFVRRQARTHWGGCFTARDWNFVEHAGDRYPSGSTNSTPKKMLDCFEDIKALCSMRDISGRGPAPKAWSYSKNTHNRTIYSHLDRIYQPSFRWMNGKIQPIDNNWLDHRIITATVYVRKPKIEKVALAPRLPNLETLEKACNFWPKVLQSWEEMTNKGPITLETWKAFKDTVLETGRTEVATIKASGWKNWIRALRDENVTPENIMNVVTKANRMIWAQCRPPARALSPWPSVAPAYEAPLHWSKHFLSSPNSPWQVPTPPVCPRHYGICWITARLHETSR